MAANEGSRVRAAVLTAVGAPLVVRDIELPAPGPDEVRVRLTAAGVCHSDLSLANGTLDQPVPAVLGHEAAGVIVSVGDEVTTVAPGDNVLLNWSPACGRCWFCQHGEPYLCDETASAWRRSYATLPEGDSLYAGLGTAAFGEQTIVPESAMTRLPAGINLEQAALLGCAMLTGIGAVVNSACVQGGESVVVFGTGGIGLSVLQGARLSRADPVIAVDVSPEKEALARRNGATEFVLAGDQVARQVRELTGGRGADHAFECVGSAKTIRQAWTSTRRGGRTTVIGIGSRTETVAFNPLEIFHFGRVLAGSVFGATNIGRDIPRLLEHLQAGRIHPEDLITRRISLDELPDALAQMAAGRGARSLVVY